MLFIYYPKCSTCQKAKKWLDAQEISYTERHIVEENPTYEELKKWQARSGLPIKKFFNTSGMLYKEMKLKEKLPSLYRTIGERFKALDCWSLYLITAYEQAEEALGLKAAKNRKIYNGMMKTYFYQFPGPKPALHKG